MYLMRLDDASEYMNWDNWFRMEKILDKYDVKPIFGIIPKNQDPDLLKYDKVADFWQLMNKWQDKGWAPALHGYSHVFETNEGGINPVNHKSEFAGVSLERQRQKIRDGYEILKCNGIEPNIFFAPAHTFDRNTLIALKEESPIRIISDTIANDVYEDEGVYFIPQQSGRCRKLPFKIVTFCYHPNITSDADFNNLEKFLNTYKNQFYDFKIDMIKKRKEGLTDRLVNRLYFARRKRNG